jgi:hypothetical protein
MRCNLHSRSNTVIAGGWSQIGGVAMDSKRQRILVAQGFPWPAGRVFAVSVRRPRQPIAEWSGLNRPGAIVVDSSQRAAMVSTADGVCELEL